MAQAFPLQWPNSIPRATRPTRSAFGSHTFAQAVAELRNQVMLLGPRVLVLSTNVPLREDGLPYSNPGKIKDPGAVLYFNLDKVDYCLPCDKWDIVEHNVWALAKHIEAMRGMRRWGVGTTHQAFAGYKALAAGRHWREVLAYGNHGVSKDQIEATYRMLAKQRHPDVGGSPEAMAELNRAREEALKEIVG
jgi:hypothetical protein